MIISSDTIEAESQTIDNIAKHKTVDETHPSPRKPPPEPAGGANDPTPEESTREHPTVDTVITTNEPVTEFTTPLGEHVESDDHHNPTINTRPMDVINSSDSNG